jgi:hypothetical protein
VRPLIALEGQDVVGLLLQDLLGDIALTAHGVDRYDGAFDLQHLKQARDGHDLIGFLSRFDLAQHKTLAGGEGRNHVDCRFNGDAIPRRAGQRPDPCHEAAPDIAEVIVGGSAVAKRPKPA